MKYFISSVLDRFKKVPEGHKIFRGTYHEGKAVYSYIPSEEDERQILLMGRWKARFHLHQEDISVKCLASDIHQIGYCNL